MLTYTVQIYKTKVVLKFEQYIPADPDQKMFWKRVCLKWEASPSSQPSLQYLHRSHYWWSWRMHGTYCQIPGIFTVENLNVPSSLLLISNSLTTIELIAMLCWHLKHMHKCASFSLDGATTSQMYCTKSLNLSSNSLSSQNSE